MESTSKDTELQMLAESVYSTPGPSRSNSLSFWTDRLNVRTSESHPEEDGGCERETLSIASLPLELVTVRHGYIDIACTWRKYYMRGRW
jgi:hypothetical protein